MAYTTESLRKKVELHNEQVGFEYIESVKQTIKNYEMGLFTSKETLEFNTDAAEIAKKEFI